MLLRRSFRAAGAQRHLHPRFLHLVASPEEAVACVRDNDAVYVHTAAATPQALTRAWTSEVLRRGLTCTAVHLHTMGDAPWLAPSSFPAISGRCLFVGANARDAVAQGRASYVPLSLSEMPRLFANGALRVDVALISVSPPDAHGWCSLGPSVDVTRSAIRAARVVVAQVNARMPRTFGAAALHASAIHVAWRCDEPLPTALSHAPRAAAAEAGDHHAASVEARIGALVAERLVPDGATLQVGIGSVPDAVLVSLRGHRDLGVHSELISDGIAELTRAGVVTNRFKAVQPGLTVTGFAVASAPHFYDFLHDNAGVTFRGFSFTNDPRVIARNPNVVALNSAIEVDLSGQAVGDACGHHVMSGVGGQGDFTRGALLCPTGKAIIALPSVTSSGVSRIVAVLTPGGGVTTPRDLAHHVVTEHGAVNLKGLTLKERARALISIAHPDHRSALADAARKQGLIHHASPVA